MITSALIREHVECQLGVAAGLAEVGLVPFASTYSVFATRRAYDIL